MLTSSDRFVLEIMGIRMKTRWYEALQRSEAAPNLAIDFGFKQTAGWWLVGSRSRMAKTRRRPKYTVDVDVPPEDLSARFLRAFESGGGGVCGAVLGANVSTNIPDQERHYWSPHMDLALRPRNAGTMVSARVGPHPHVWTLFLAFHTVNAFLGLAGTMYGLSQWMMDGPAWGLLSLPAALCLHAFVAGAAFVGQGLGADHVYRLRTFVDDVLAA